MPMMLDTKWLRQELNRLKNGSSWRWLEQLLQRHGIELKASKVGDIKSMTAGKCILILDDDTFHLEDIGNQLRESGYRPILCANVESAVRELSAKPDLVIVDLYLDGDIGDELSNNFIINHLIPKSIPFARMTSAPNLVPQAVCGRWVFDKRRYRQNPGQLLQLLKATFVDASNAIR